MADRAFDALTTVEITQAVTAARARPGVSPAIRIVTVSLEEPDKDSIVSGRPVARVGRVVSYDAARDDLVETLVDVASGRALSSRHVANAQPMLGPTDAARADALVRTDARWVAAMNRRGISDISHVVGVTWSAGYFGDTTVRGRVVRVIPHVREGRDDRFFLRPIEGVSANVNLTTGIVIDVSDDDVAPLATVTTFAPDDGASAAAGSTARNAAIKLAGGTIRWRHWRLHVAAHPREGVVLHHVAYSDGSRERSMLYRAAVSEMVVPYGDPDRAWFVRNALDEGELGLGRFATPLRTGLDVPADAILLPATIADEAGNPIVHPAAIAVYERDGGLAWRYNDAARRSRELVVEWFSSLGNYEYGFAWIFREDGSIEQKTTLTGIMALKGARRLTRDATAARDPHGQRVSDVLVAPHHQHFFAFRLDTDVDGAGHQGVVEVEGQPSTVGDDHAGHAAIMSAATPLTSEQRARRFVSGPKSRRWIVLNGHVRNAVGDATGISLMPGENALPLADTSAWIRKRAGFLDAQLWVTPYRAGELYAAGEYPNQSRGGDGLPAFTRSNASISDTDVVLWYVMGITHLPRPEDWPVMPAHVAGFRLVPTGFFDANPLVRPSRTR